MTTSDPGPYVFLIRDNITDNTDQSEAFKGRVSGRLNESGDLILHFQTATNGSALLCTFYYLSDGEIQEVEIGLTWAGESEPEYSI